MERSETETHNVHHAKMTPDCLTEGKFSLQEADVVNILPHQHPV